MAELSWAERYLSLSLGVGGRPLQIYSSLWKEAQSKFLGKFLGASESPHESWVGRIPRKLISIFWKIIILHQLLEKGMPRFRPETWIKKKEKRLSSSVVEIYKSRRRGRGLDHMDQQVQGLI